MASYSIFAGNKRVASVYTNDNGKVENFIRLSENSRLIFQSVEDGINRINQRQNEIRDRHEGISEEVKAAVIKRLEGYKSKIFENNY